eukprot:scaffold11452_cov38-Prasinocladus_malaysianus.AAC.3
MGTNKRFIDIWRLKVNPEYPQVCSCTHVKEKHGIFVSRTLHVAHVILMAASTSQQWLATRYHGCGPCDGL